jgi:hypothetical protein
MSGDRQRFDLPLTAKSVCFVAPAQQAEYPLAAQEAAGGKKETELLHRQERPEAVSGLLSASGPPPGAYRCRTNSEAKRLKTLDL